MDLNELKQRFEARQAKAAAAAGAATDLPPGAKPSPHVSPAAAKPLPPGTKPVPQVKTAKDPSSGLTKPSAGAKPSAAGATKPWRPTPKPAGPTHDGGGGAAVTGTGVRSQQPKAALSGTGRGRPPVMRKPTGDPTSPADPPGQFQLPSAASLKPVKKVITNETTPKGPPNGPPKAPPKGPPKTAAKRGVPAPVNSVTRGGTPTQHKPGMANGKVAKDRISSHESSASPAPSPSPVTGKRASGTSVASAAEKFGGKISLKPPATPAKPGAADKGWKPRAGSTASTASTASSGSAAGSTGSRDSAEPERRPRLDRNNNSAAPTPAPVKPSWLHASVRKEPDVAEPVGEIGGGDPEEGLEQEGEGDGEGEGPAAQPQPSPSPPPHRVAAPPPKSSWLHTAAAAALVASTATPIDPPGKPQPGAGSKQSSFPPLPPIPPMPGSSPRPERGHAQPGGTAIAADFIEDDDVYDDVEVKPQSAPSLPPLPPLPPFPPLPPLPPVSGRSTPDMKRPGHPLADKEEPPTGPRDSSLPLGPRKPLPAVPDSSPDRNATDGEDDGEVWPAPPAPLASTQAASGRYRLRPLGPAAGPPPPKPPRIDVDLSAFGGDLPEVADVGSPPQEIYDDVAAPQVTSRPTSVDFIPEMTEEEEQRLHTPRPLEEGEEEVVEGWEEEEYDDVASPANPPPTTLPHPESDDDDIYEYVEDL